MMRFITLIFLAALVFMWLLLAAYFAGVYQPGWLPHAIRALKLPTTTADLGQSFAVLDGLLSSVAIVLGLIAILLQGRELKMSTAAQTVQAAAIAKQIEQQSHSNQLGAFAARLQFLLTEADRLESQISDLRDQVENERDVTAKENKWNIIKNSRALQVDYRKQAKDIDKTIQQLLGKN